MGTRHLWPVRRPLRGATGWRQARGDRIYYRCGGHSAAGDAASERCTSPSVQAAWLEQEIWRDCAEYVRNPDQALAEAQRQLQERTQHASGSAETRAQLTKGLVEKAREREDVVRLYRRKSLDLVQLHERY